MDIRPMQDSMSGAYLSASTRYWLHSRHAHAHGKTQREIAKEVGVSPTLVNFVIRDAMNALASCRGAFDERASV